MYMSTPENAWQILMSDAETNVGSYYVTLPAHGYKDMMEAEDAVFDLNQHRFEQFKIWKDDSSPDKSNFSWKYSIGNKIYDAEKYPTLFDYYESEVYVLPPTITGLDADYVIVNLAAEKLSDENIIDLYVLKQKGGDETKSFWFMKIADLDILDYYNPELSGYSGKFWDETLLGKLIPFTHILYVNPNNPELQSETFKPGYTSIYVKDIKFPSDGDGPFQLVYLPPSFEMDAPGPLTGPIIYKINKEYNPNQ